MAILILLVFMGLFVHDALVTPGGPGQASAVRDWLAAGSSDGVRLALMIGPKLFIAVVFSLACRASRRKMAVVGSPALRKLDLVQAACRYLMLVSYFVDLYALGALVRLRQTIGDPILLDELLVIAPTLALNAWMWWAYYPIDARMRAATLMGRLDRGQPVHVWSRGQYMLSQVRHQWALMGLPLLMLVAWWETVRIINPKSADLAVGLMLGGALVVFIFTPPLMRYIWDTAPLPKGELRDRLIAMCDQYRVRVRELLLWRTFGGMINGAVMGMFGPVRYILLTDALLESMPAKQVEAVMAHELAHVRKRHIFWLLLVAAASMEVMRRAMTWLIEGTLEGIDASGAGSWLPASVSEALKHPDVAALAATVVSIVGWFFIFGWVSRRFERQADTFAVQHLSRQWHDEQGSGAPSRQGGAEGERIPTSSLASDSRAPTAPPCRDGALPPLPDADTLIAQLEAGLATLPPPPASRDARDPSRIPVAAAAIMEGALQSVADLNCIPVGRKSWRHGSIAWRQQYLRELAGKPIDSTEIDQQVNRIKLAGLCIVVIAVVMGVMQIG
ncbi:MAG: M48 family metalloprotease [Phycisphaeraceae bacterium]